jgi:hypothetical protein
MPGSHGKIIQFENLYGEDPGQKLKERVNSVKFRRLKKIND